MFGRVLRVSAIVVLGLTGLVFAQSDTDIKIGALQAQDFMIELPASLTPGSEWPVPHADSILDWSLTAPTGDSGRTLLARADYISDIHDYWFRTTGDDPLMNVRPYYGQDSDEFNRVLILWAGEFKAYSFSFLSFWSQRGREMRLVRLIPNPAQSDDYYCVPLFAATFPDGSLLIASEMKWGDGDSQEEDYHFVRVDRDYGAAEFYSIKSAYAYDGKRVTIGDRAAVNGNYQIVVTTEYLSDHQRTYTTQRPANRGRLRTGQEMQEFSRIDSVKTEIVDLWQKATNKLGLDTTGIGNH